MKPKPVPEVTGRTIVVCDDMDPMRMLLRVWCTEARLVVVGEAANARGLVQVVSASSPDAAVVDLHLPDRHGAEAIRQLRTLRPRLVLIAYSGADREIEEVRALQAGADAFVGKGDPPDRLIHALQACLMTTRRGRAHAA